MSNLTTILNMFVVSLRNSQKLLVRDYNELEYLRSNPDSANKFVQNSIDRVNTVIFEDLQKLRPKYSYVLSDGKKVEGSDSSNTIYINAIDGVENFKRANPLFTMSIGLERDGESYSSAIFSPISNEMFLAEKGYGAYLNNRRLRIPAMPQPLIAIADSSNITPSKQILLRISGCFSLDMSYYAACRFGAVYYSNVDYKKTLATNILVTEAGGNITDVNGDVFSKESQSLVACSVGRLPEWKKFLNI